jgi:hypothetical protein
MFLRNVVCLSTDYTALHPRRQYSSTDKTVYVTSEIGIEHLSEALPLKTNRSEKKVCFIDRHMKFN